jgi:hypothetical protein
MTWKTGAAFAPLLLGIAALALPAASQQPGQDQLFDPPPQQQVQPKDAAPKAAPKSDAKAAPKSDAKAAPKSAAKAAPKSAAKAKAAPAGTMVGTWTGKVTQVGHDTGFTVVLTVRQGGGGTEYPELGCTGTLSRVAGSGAYVFYLEKITKGRHDAGGRCPDGTVTIALAGDKLGMSWFGSAEGTAVVVYGLLTRK